jgi:hypothetical protein
LRCCIILAKQFQRQRYVLTNRQRRNKIEELKDKTDTPAS